MKPDYPLLGLLARRPASGYELGKWLRSEGLFLGRTRSMTPVYRAIGEFVELGWVETPSDVPEAAAKVYSLTAEGRRALQEWAETEYVPAARPMSPDFMVRLNFAGQFGPKYALRIVRTELEYRKQQRADEGYPTLPSVGAEPIPEVDREWLTYIDVLTHDRGWHSTSLYIGWLETTERRLTELLADEQEKESGL